MKTRPYEPNDFPEIKELIEQNKDFPVPDLSSPLYALKEVALDHKGQIIGVGIVRITSEVILIIDKKRSLPDKMIAIKTLLKKGVEESKKIGLDEWHAFVADTKFVKLLEKLNFKKSEVTTLFRSFYG